MLRTVVSAYIVIRTQEMQSIVLCVGISLVLQWLKRIGVNDESISNYKFGNGDFFNLHFYL